jgi:DNA ligase 1
MELERLVRLVAQIRATTKKSEKVSMMATFLNQTHGRETELAALYLSGSLPQGRIGVGWRLIEQAVPTAVEPGPGLLLADVDHVFIAIAKDTGPGSTQRKIDALRTLFQRTDPEGRRFLGELLMGELRQGALEGLVLEAIAKATGISGTIVRQAMMFSGNLGAVARTALEEGESGLGRFSLRVLSPVAPMLANTAEDVGDAIARLGRAAFEYKLDGARIQVHRADDVVRVFTRQLQDVTERLPEVVEWTRQLPTRRVVLEGEAIALRADGRPQPFQHTMRRLGRDKDIEAARMDMPLSFQFFDCLYREGEGGLVVRPYHERVDILRQIVPAESIIPRIITAETAEAESFLEQAFEAGHEGLMAKSLQSPYTAGHRGSQWLKLKAAKTLDLVVLAAEWGNGRRTGWLSNLHLGARDPSTGQFVMLGKTFKGLTDELLRWQTEHLLSLESSRDPMTVYVRPELVVEIAFSDVQQSPRYPGGLALRFARVKRYRPDKTSAEADTIQTVMDIFQRQRQ